MMSINNATPADWDRLRKEIPAIEPSVLRTDVVYDSTDVWVKVAHEENCDAWEPDTEDDVVNNPDHYNTGNIECIEAIEESMSAEAFKGYLKGNCMKYLWRYDYKGKPAEDLQKAQWYLAKLLQEVVFENES